MSNTIEPSLADSLGLAPNESLKTKVPLRQIVQFVDRLQKQSSTVLFYISISHFVYYQVLAGLEIEKLTLPGC